MSLLESNENTSLLDNASASVAVPSAVVERSAFVVPTATSAKRRADKPLQVADPWMGGLDWGTIIWFSIVHAGCLAAPFFFTWKAVGLFFGLYWLTGGVGICLGYHRLLTHGSFQTYRPVKWLIAFLG